MKISHRIATAIYLLFFSTDLVPKNLFFSSPIAPNNIGSMKHLTESVVTYPLTLTTEDGTLQQGIQNRTIKAMTPQKTWPILAKGNFTVLKPKSSAFKNYPNGAVVFPNHPDLSTKFDTMILNLKKHPEFIPFFRKVHINALNELYHYLMSIYTNFNLQHVGITQNSTGALQVNIPKFLNDEDIYASNKKTLIINHMINIIESQFNSAIKSYVPKIPQTFASFMGKTLIQNDYCIDLTVFITKQIEPEIIKNKQLYMTALATYLDFFQTYTSYLNKPSSKNRNHKTAFIDIAETINAFLYSSTHKKIVNQKENLAIAKMDPPLFSINYDDIRALKLIPYLAQLLPPQTKKITWPDHIVQAATEGLIVDGHPIAYFKDDNGKVTSQAQAAKLFICLASGDNMFEEELIAEPKWLGSWEGISKILRACFGDFSALLGMEILDPCMESLIHNVLLAQQGKDINADDLPSGACKAFIKSWKTDTQTPSNLPTGPNLLNTTSNFANPLGLPSVITPTIQQPGA